LPSPDGEYSAGNISHGTNSSIDHASPELLLNADDVIPWANVARPEQGSVPEWLHPKLDIQVLEFPALLFINFPKKAPLGEVSSS